MHLKISTKQHFALTGMDGAYLKTIIAGNLHSPSSLAIDPRLARLYWADEDARQPRIEYSQLNGNGRRVLVNNDLTPIVAPTSLTIDHFKDFRVLWMDKVLRKIQAINPDGSNHRLITNIRNVKGQCNTTSALASRRSYAKEKMSGRVTKKTNWYPE